jgi:CDP-6-deoxy-D-xylo-4-hexulose-3-dehydrase
LRKGLEGTPGVILPHAQENSNPSWFGFLISVKSDSKFTRTDLTQYLESQKIQTRNLFAGNLILHPAFNEMRESGKGYRQIGDLKNTNFIMNNSFWIGVFPGMTQEMNDHMINSIREFCESHT